MCFAIFEFRAMANKLMPKSELINWCSRSYGESGKPVFVTVPDENNNALFVCKLSLPDGKNFISNPFKRKKEAEHDASLLALADINKISKEESLNPKVGISLDEKWRQLIDRIEYCFSSSVAPTHSCMKYHFHVSVKNGNNFGAVPFGSLFVSDSKILNLCKSFHPEIENHPLLLLPTLKLAIMSSPRLYLFDSTFPSISTSSLSPPPSSLSTTFSSSSSSIIPANAEATETTTSPLPSIASSSSSSLSSSAVASSSSSSLFNFKMEGMWVQRTEPFADDAISVLLQRNNMETSSLKLKNNINLQKNIVENTIEPKNKIEKDGDKDEGDEEEEKEEEGINRESESVVVMDAIILPSSLNEKPKPIKMNIDMEKEYYMNVIATHLGFKDAGCVLATRVGGSNSITRIFSSLPSFLYPNCMHTIHDDDDDDDDYCNNDRNKTNYIQNLNKKRIECEKEWLDIKDAFTCLLNKSKEITASNIYACIENVLSKYKERKKNRNVKHSIYDTKFSTDINKNDDDNGDRVDNDGDCSGNGNSIDGIDGHATCHATCHASWRDFNPRASWISSQPIFGNALLAFLGNSWSTKALTYSDFTLTDLYTIMMNRTVEGSYRVSRHGFLLPRLPSSFQSMENWRGKTPKSMLIEYFSQNKKYKNCHVRFQTFLQTPSPLPPLPSLPSLPSLSSLPNLHHSHPSSFTNNNDGNGDKKKESMDEGESIPLIKGFKCKLSIEKDNNSNNEDDDGGNKECLYFESENSYRSQSEASHSAALSALRHVIKKACDDDTCQLFHPVQIQSMQSLLSNSEGRKEEMYGGLGCFLFVGDAEFRFHSHVHAVAQTYSVGLFDCIVNELVKELKSEEEEEVEGKKTKVDSEMEAKGKRLNEKEGKKEEAPEGGEVEDGGEGEGEYACDGRRKWKSMHGKDESVEEDIDGEKKQEKEDEKKEKVEERKEEEKEKEEEEKEEGEDFNASPSIGSLVSIDYIIYCLNDNFSQNCFQKLLDQEFMDERNEKSEEDKGSKAFIRMKGNEIDRGGEGERRGRKIQEAVMKLKGNVLEVKKNFEFEFGSGGVFHAVDTCVGCIKKGDVAVFQCQLYDAFGIFRTQFSNEKEDEKKEANGEYNSMKVECCIKLLNFFASEEEEIEQAIFHPPLSKQRMNFVMEEIKKNNHIHSLVDFGCGSGSLLERLFEFTGLRHVAGLDVDKKSLSRAIKSLNKQILKRQKSTDSIELSNKSNEFDSNLKFELYHGSLDSTNPCLRNFDMATCIEVVEHLDPEPLSKFGELILGYYQPKILIVSTPNIECNPIIQARASKATAPNQNHRLGNDTKLRNHDHRFEWTRKEFQEWSNGIARTYEYDVSFFGVGTMDETEWNVDECGFASQIAIFCRKESLNSKGKNRSVEEKHLNFHELNWEATL